MKRKIRSLFALFLMFTVLCSIPLPAVAYSDALGEEVRKTNTDVHQETMLSTNVFWSSTFSNFRTENFITYHPNASVRPLVTYGDALTDVSTMSKAVRFLESTGYRVVCGINGDFFNTKNGLPVGLVVTDGQIRSSDAGLYAIGFRSDGSALIGKPNLKIHADFGYKIYEESGYGTQVVRDIAAINKARVSDGGIFLFTRDFNASHTTGNTEPGYDAVCDIISGSLSIGGTLKVRVKSVGQVQRSTPIGAGQIVLSVNLKSADYWQKAFRGLPVGSEITLTVTADNEQWNTVRDALGALYLLAENGRVVNTLQTSNGPRTAVGQKPDGSLVFYTIDGRLSGHSIGSTLKQSAQRLLELGCTTVLGLDGGGSTTISVTMPDATKAATINVPSDGAERAVSTKLFLVSSQKATGLLDHFYLKPDNALVLAGSKIRFNVTGVDTAYWPMQSAYTLSASDGSMDGSVLTTPKNGGSITVTASGQSKNGSTVVQAVSTPDAIAIRDQSGKALESLNIAPGTSVQLSATASYKHLRLYAEQEAFTWVSGTRSGDMTPAGQYTAVTPGDDTITVSCGGRSLSIPVTVSKVRLIELDGFETAPNGYGDGAAMVSAVGGEYARYGRGAAELHYDLSGLTPTVSDENSTRIASAETQDAGLSGSEPLPDNSAAAPSDVYGENVIAILPGFEPAEETSLPEESGSDMGDAETQSVSAHVTETQSASVDSAWSANLYNGVMWDDDAQWNGVDAVSVDEDENLYGDASDSGEESPDVENGDTAEQPIRASGVQWRYAHPVTMPAVPYDTVSIWVKGDSSGNRFSLLCHNTDGTESAVPVTALDFSEWRRILVPVGSSVNAITGFAVNAPSGTSDDQIFGATPRTGIIYLDQMVATYNDTVDSTPPTVSISQNYNVIRASVRDALDGVLPKNYVSATVNGLSVASSYDTETGNVVVTLPALGATQEPVRVTVTARDASGNIGRNSVDIAPYNVPNKFNDIEGCWAADYINFLYNRNIAEPYPDGSYHPYDIITRAEFAVMLARAVNLDGRVYADVELPYADLDEIPESALPALRALYAENIMRGATGDDGRLYLMPNSGLTRAHASAMIGRSQKLGYGSAELPFPDADTIPAYAVPHIKTMVARGILEGYADGYFRSGNNISRGQMAKILYFLA